MPGKKFQAYFPDPPKKTKSKQGKKHGDLGVCHNHLKQPLKKWSYPGHHQGTCYLSIFSLDFLMYLSVLLVDDVLDWTKS